jgi:hypothetical protein
MPPRAFEQGLAHALAAAFGRDKQVVEDPDAGRGKRGEAGVSSLVANHHCDRFITRGSVQPETIVDDA